MNNQNQAQPQNQPQNISNTNTNNIFNNKNDNQQQNNMGNNSQNPQNNKNSTFGINISFENMNLQNKEIPSNNIFNQAGFGQHRGIGQTNQTNRNENTNPMQYSFGNNVVVTLTGKALIDMIEKHYPDKLTKAKELINPSEEYTIDCYDMS